MRALLAHYPTCKNKTRQTLAALNMLVACSLLTVMAPGVFGAPGDIVLTSDIPEKERTMAPVVFPHWKHRINYRCDACHNSLFKMEKGADTITMEMIEKGESCGVCHNGQTAFKTDFTNCARCHMKPAS